MTRLSIHKEGYPTLAYTFLIMLVLNATAYFVFRETPSVRGFILTLSVVTFFLILFFFRKPERNILTDPGKVIAPADGLVVAIEEVDDTEYFHERRIQVSIFMTMLDIHMNLCPISGSVTYLKYHPGSYLVAMHPKSSHKNERTTTVIENSRHAVLVRQIAGGIARRVVTYPVTGEQVEQGDELGFIKFGSRVDLLLPVSSRIQAKLRRRVVAGRTVIATLP